MFGILFTWHVVNHFVILVYMFYVLLSKYLLILKQKTRLISTKTADKHKSLHYYKSHQRELDEDVNVEMTAAKELYLIGNF